MLGPNERPVALCNSISGVAVKTFLHMAWTVYISLVRSRPIAAPPSEEGAVQPNPEPQPRPGTEPWTGLALSAGMCQLTSLPSPQCLFLFRCPGPYQVRNLGSAALNIENVRSRQMSTHFLSFLPKFSFQYHCPCPSPCQVWNLGMSLANYLILVCRLTCWRFSLSGFPFPSAHPGAFARAPACARYGTLESLLSAALNLKAQRSRRRRTFVNSQLTCFFEQFQSQFPCPCQVRNLGKIANCCAEGKACVRSSESYLTTSFFIFVPLFQFQFQFRYHCQCPSPCQVRRA
jgi:hypothetical protein